MTLKKKIRIIGILLMSLGMFVFLSLLFHLTSAAPMPNQEEVAHSMGFAGDWVSRTLFSKTIGYAAFIFPMLVFAWGINLILIKKISSLLKITAYALLFSIYFSVGLALFEIIKNTAQSTGIPEKGPIELNDVPWGIIGGFLGKQFFKLVGTAGSIIFYPTIVIVTLLWLFDVKLGSIKVRIFHWLALASAFIGRKYNRRRFKPKRSASAGAETPSNPKQPLKIRGDLPEIRLPEQEPEIEPMKKPLPIAFKEDWNDEEIERPKTEVLNEKPPRINVSRKYNFPEAAILNEANRTDDEVAWDELMNNAKTLEERLADFGIKGKVIEISPGPVITRFEIEPAPGVKISRFTSLADDLALVMRAKRIRVVAPIPGKAAIGIEIPNRKSSMVFLKAVIDTARFRASNSPLTLALGKTIAGDIYVDDLASMPHLLIAGSTGSGKSVCLNTIIASMLFKATPDQLQFVLIDPKRLELSVYSALKYHHLTYRHDLKEEVVTNPANAVLILRSLELEMERRYELLAKAGMRNIDDYNKWVKSSTPTQAAEAEQPVEFKPLHFIVLIIDELADLMLTAAREVEEPIARLTQMSRAVGIHLIVATQRPSVDVITGVIKANFPARIAFQVASKTDSRTILDMNGAEKLLGKGDMLFLPPSSPEPIRIHGAYISHDEIKRIIGHVRQQPIQEPKFMLPTETDEIASRLGRNGDEEQDELFNEALKLVVRHQQGSVSLLQRRLKIGYARAGRIMDQLEAAGYVGPFDGSKAREVLLDEDELMEMGLY